jgi:hypothetical protein
VLGEPGAGHRAAGAPGLQRGADAQVAGGFAGFKPGALLAVGDDRGASLGLGLGGELADLHIAGERARGPSLGFVEDLEGALWVVGLEVQPDEGLGERLLVAGEGGAVAGEREAIGHPVPGAPGVAELHEGALVVAPRVRDVAQARPRAPRGVGGGVAEGGEVFEAVLGVVEAAGAQRDLGVQASAEAQRGATQAELLGFGEVALCARHVVEVLGEHRLVQRELGLLGRGGVVPSLLPCVRQRRAGVGRAGLARLRGVELDPAERGAVHRADAGVLRGLGGDGLKGGQGGMGALEIDEQAGEIAGGAHGHCVVGEVPGERVGGAVQVLGALWLAEVFGELGAGVEGRGAAGRVGDAVVDGAGALQQVAGLHQIMLGAGDASGFTPGVGGEAGGARGQRGVACAAPGLRLLGGGGRGGRGRGGRRRESMVGFGWRRRGPPGRRPGWARRARR